MVAKAKIESISRSRKTMPRQGCRLVSLFFTLVAAGCASNGYEPGLVAAASTVGQDSRELSIIQCVSYAREHSDIKIFGDAHTWWSGAEGKYNREATPLLGGVMVLYNYAGNQRGHVAVVKSIINAREIRIDHANWLNDGAIYINDPVFDVSPNNDWSVVRVWNIKAGGWGRNIYQVQGFIGRLARDETIRSSANRLTSRANRMKNSAEVASHSTSTLLDSVGVQGNPSVGSGHQLTPEDLAIPAELGLP